MPIGEFCNREVVYATRETSIPVAAQLMRHYHVGDLVVVDEVDDKRVPIGIVTDRDIVIEIISQSLDLNEFNVGDIMSPQLLAEEMAELAKVAPREQEREAKTKI
jgi:CBS domain-containing protein